MTHFDFGIRVKRKIFAYKRPRNHEMIRYPVKYLNTSYI